jgi:hypothetical protein
MALICTTPSLNVCRPESVSVRETRFSRDKHLGTEGVHQCTARETISMNELGNELDLNGRKASQG